VTATAGPDGVREAAAREVADGRYLAFDAFDDWGIHALATTRAAGTFSSAADEPVGAVLGRWAALQRHLDPSGAGRFASAHQVHGADVVDHLPGWTGWLRAPAADGHLAADRGTAMAVTVADCVPVYVAHRSGAAAMLHAGWRGTAAGILGVAVRRLAALRRPPAELRVLLGPAICGRCYEVSPDVYGQLTGRAVDRPTPVSLHAVLAGQARALGVRDVRATALCTRCDHARHYSHRAGDAGRQLGVLLAAVDG
jgi:YfiH family protein